MDIEQKDKFIELRAGGMSFDNISKQLNISKPTLLKLNRELAADIDRLKFINIESLAERYKMLRTARIDTLSKTLDKVDSAIEAADFGRLPADKLIEMRLKLADKMMDELRCSYTFKGANTLFRDKDMLDDWTFSLD